MANSKQAKKRARQALKNRDINFALRTEYRTAIKKVLKAILAGKKTEAEQEFKSTQSVLDRISRKGIFHKNKTARHKSRLSAKIKNLETASTVTA